MRFFTPMLAGALLASTALIGANAETLRWAAAGDSLTLDPHAQNEGPTHTVAHQMYEPLLHRDMSMAVIPALATAWAPTDDPTVWEFKLREGVKFHEGQDFTAEDVVFSFNRAKHEKSDMKELIGSISLVEAVDDYTVHIHTDGPNPLLPNNLTNLHMMDSGWTTENGSAVPADIAANEENFAHRNANGTGAFKLVSRSQDELTVMVKNEDYWGTNVFPHEVSEIRYTPISNAATRIAALLSGEVDIVTDVPVQDLDRLRASGEIKVVSTPQNRTIFLGMNQGADDLVNDDVVGANPFADLRVRQAMDLAIDRGAIMQVVMRGDSAPTGIIAPPFVNGWTAEHDIATTLDVDAAKALLAEANYPDGFGVTLHCPNDRYMNDAAICQAVTGMLGRIGINVTLDARPKAVHFAELQNRIIDFYMLGWGVPTFDSEYIFNFLVHTTDENKGSWNATGYSNAEVDAMIDALSSMTDIAMRDETIGKIWDQVQQDVLYLPLHHQVVNWAMRSDIEFPAQGENQAHFKFLQFAN
jgi:peptide/nickel transport system substrate-binding protein